MLKTKALLIKKLCSRFLTRRFFAAAVFGLALISAPVTDALTTRDKIYPGTTVGTLELGGMDVATGTTALEKYFADFLGQSIDFILDEQRTTLPINELIAFDAPATINSAIQIGHQESLAQAIQQRLNARLSGIKIDPVFIIKNDHLITSLRSAFPEYGTPPQNAKFDFAFIKNKPPVITVLAEQSGKDINSDAVLKQVGERALSFSNTPILVLPKGVESKITKEDLAQLLPALEKLFSAPAPTIKFKEQKWTIDYPTLAKWIVASPHPTPLPRGEGDAQSGEGIPQGPTLQLDEEMVNTWLDGIAKQITKNPQDAEFELSEDGKKVIKFSMAEDGLTLPREKNITLISNAIFKGETPELVLESIAPKIFVSKTAEDFGIKDLVGQGTTNFAGSPSNRIKNIKRGAELLYGEIIEPDENFSLLEHLRPFTLENKYLPELVIKAAEGKTVPEIGGGLCQIGTTMFRTVLNSGLPVLFRRNHSYRVSYYEPPVGMDATIYDPWPDFKFTNDTGHRLLLTTEVAGTKITFSLWGIKDNRQINITDPEAFNFVRPPEKKIIETLNLPPGTTKCTERAHIGSDAKFTYTVTYPDNEIKQTEFLSHYQPWQEVCLLGVTALSTPPPENNTNIETLPSADAVGVIGN